LTKDVKQRVQERVQEEIDSRMKWEMNRFLYSLFLKFGSMIGRVGGRLLSSNQDIGYRSMVIHNELSFGRSVIPGLTPYQVRGRLRNSVSCWIPAFAGMTPFDAIYAAGYGLNVPLPKTFGLLSGVRSGRMGRQTSAPEMPSLAAIIWRRSFIFLRGLQPRAPNLGRPSRQRRDRP
jgi:hypothetical protein